MNKGLKDYRKELEFVCLNFMNRNDGCPDICKYTLIVNGNIDLYK